MKKSELEKRIKFTESNLMDISSEVSMIINDLSRMLFSPDPMNDHRAVEIMRDLYRLDENIDDAIIDIAPND